MKISIVIPAYNEEKYIGKTLNSINNLDKDGHDVETIVINGGSTDQTEKIAKSYGAKVINEPHRGIGFARQEGLKHATGDIVAFTDADTVVGQDWLIRHIEVLQKPGVVFTYGTFRVKDGRFPYFHFINYIQWWAQWIVHHLFGAPFAAGQNQAFWREKAIEIGGYNSDLKMFEDTDLAVRMKKIGKVVFLPNLIVISSGRRSQEGLGMFWRSTIVTIKYFFFQRRDLGSFPDIR